MNLEAVIERVWGCTWTPRLCNSGMHLEAVIERVWRCIWRPRSSNSEMHLEAMIERVWRCIWTPRLRNSEMHLEAVSKRDWRSTGRPRLSNSEISVSNGSGLPGFGPGWNWPEGPGPGQEPRSNPTCCIWAGSLPWPDINPRFFGRVEPGPQFHITVPAILAPITYLRSDRITIWSVCRLCSFSRYFTSRCQMWD